MTTEQELDLALIKGGDPVDAIEAAKRRIAEGADSEFINGLLEVAQDEQRHQWARSAAIYVIGFTDHEGTTESALRAIACNEKQNPLVRDHAEDALYMFAQHRRAVEAEINDPEATVYEDQSFEEWRKEQTDLPATAPFQPSR